MDMYLYKNKVIDYFNTMTLTYLCQSMLCLALYGSPEAWLHMYMYVCLCNLMTYCVKILRLISYFQFNVLCNDIVM